jgi:hypothetical protein
MFAFGKNLTSGVRLVLTPQANFIISFILMILGTAVGEKFRACVVRRRLSEQCIQVR